MGRRRRKGGWFASFRVRYCIVFRTLPRMGKGGFIGHPLVFFFKVSCVCFIFIFYCLLYNTYPPWKSSTMQGASRPAGKHGKRYKVLTTQERGRGGISGSLTGNSMGFWVLRRYNT